MSFAAIKADCFSFIHFCPCFAALSLELIRFFEFESATCSNELFSIINLNVLPNCKLSINAQLLFIN